MSASADASTALVATVPTMLRARIVSGMRWTLWLSALGVPFSYGTTIVLARTGPEVIATYGLLLLYAGIVSCVFYLGGDAVVIKFIPELEPAKRLSFLLSYFFIIIAALVPWVVLGTLWPQSLRYVLGGSAASSFQLVVLCLSPIYIAFSLVVANLKAMLDMRWAHTLLRALGVGTFAVYGVLYLGFCDLLRAHYTGIVWGTFLALTVVLSAVGLRRLLRRSGEANELRPLRFFLPRGFWRYTLSLQQASVLRMVAGRLDYVLILNSGGLAVLGEYVAMMLFVQTIRSASNYFLDTLLPALTNLLASGDRAGASRLFAMHLRILFVLSTTITCALMFLAQPITTLLGPQYATLGHSFVVLVLCFGLSLPGEIGGTLLTSTGKQQRAVWVSMGQLALFVFLFFALWPRWGLLGAVLAYGISLFASDLALLAVAKRSVGLEFSVLRDYSKFVLVELLAGALGVSAVPNHLGLVGPAWLAAVGGFLYLARYRLAECVGVLRCYVPGEFLDRTVQRFIPFPRVREEFSGHPVSVDQWEQL